MYTTHYIATYDECKKASKALARPKNLKLILLCTLIGSILFCLIFRSILRAFIWSLLLLLIVTLEVFLIRIIKTKLVWKSNKSFQNLDSKITFNEHDFTIENQYENSTFPYNLIHKVIETKTNFYILLSQTVGFTIIKNNCSEELINFIRKI